MASIHRDPRSPYWFAFFTLPDGRRTSRSTKEKDRTKALKIALQFETASKTGAAGRLTDTQARKVISDIFSIANADALATSTIKAFLTRWLEVKELETGEKTSDRYGLVVSQLLEHLGPLASQVVVHLSAKHIVAFRDKVAKRTSPATANFSLKVIRSALNHALRSGLVDHNDALKVQTLSLRKAKQAGQRRPFSEEELRALFKVADPEWKGLILTSLYGGGLRLGDVARLTWRQVDLHAEEIHLQTAKTGRYVSVPIPKPLLRFLTALPSTDNPDAPLFPAAFAVYEKSYYNGDLSKKFRRLLVQAGLASERKYRGTGAGGQVPHRQSELSFHSLRHSATTMLKAAGVSDSITMDLVGHESPAVSRNYTKIPMAVKRDAMNKLPDVLS